MEGTADRDFSKAFDKRPDDSLTIKVEMCS